MNASIRELRSDDAPLMLEWMHDESVQRCFRNNFHDMTMSDAYKFCENASKIQLKDGNSIHYAIVDAMDEYIGTISLKNIDLNSKNAEYAIVLRRQAQGKGNAYNATKLILHKAFYELNLHRVYLTVLANNVRAIRLYERCGFKCEGELREHISVDGVYANWKLFGILESEFAALTKGECR